ncbi:MAG: hypothetical protein AVDCRST_MAG57-1821, partial [uncultured Blastococcus sp.]
GRQGPAGSCAPPPGRARQHLRRGVAALRLAPGAGDDRPPVAHRGHWLHQRAARPRAGAGARRPGEPGAAGGGAARDRRSAGQHRHRSAPAARPQPGRGL